MQFTSGAGYYQRFEPQGEAQRGASLRTWEADVDRLSDEIERAAGDVGWAALRISADDGSSARHLTRAWLMMPDNRTVIVMVGWAEVTSNDNAEDETSREDDHPVRPMTASVRVGLLGDSDLQTAYLDALQARLAGKAKRRVGGYFELPDFRFPKLERLGLSRLRDGRPVQDGSPEDSKVRGSDDQ
jgi:hypothetical protein